MEVEVYNQDGKKAGTAELPDKIFGLPWNADLVHQVVTSQIANLRRPIAHTKGRGEVRGGGRKPWRQKGTGRARAGSIRSPLWKGGGVTHGPTKEKNYYKKINKKMAAKALATILSAKARDKELIMIDELRFEQSKTKQASKLVSGLAKVKVFADIAKKSKRALLLLAKGDKIVMRAFRNLSAIELAEARNVTAAKASQRKFIIIPKPAAEVLAKRLTG